MATPLATPSNEGRAALTLGDLLDEPRFGLELRAGDGRARRAAVDGIHCLEVSDPLPWLEQRWVMLTVGAQPAFTEQAQRQLVARLDEGGIAALGFGLGAIIDDVPPALLDEANARGFPVFTAPYETPFREIVSYVNQSVLSHDLHVLRRLATMQQYLFDALREVDAERELLTRLSGFLGGAGVAYLDACRTVRAGVGPVEVTDDLFADSRSSGVHELDRDGRWALVLRVPDGKTDGWLVATAQRRLVSREIAKPLIQAGANLLAVLGTARKTAARGGDHARRHLASRCLRVVHGARDAQLTVDLIREGLDLSAGARVVVVDLPGQLDEHDAVDELELAAGDQGLPLLAFRDEARLLLLVPDAALDVVRDVLRRALRCENAGLSEPFDREHGLADAAEQAAFALAIACLRRESALLRFEDLPPEVIVLGRAAPATSESLADFIAPLLDHPPLLEATEVYLQTGFDSATSAARLHLHRNSLRNRLSRAEAVLGRPLRDPSTVTCLHLALLLRNLGHISGDPRATT